MRYGGIGSSRLVGRDDEVAVLGQLLDSARCGRGSVAFVVGEPGSGKSRLVRELCAAADDADIQVLTGRAGPVGTCPPLRPVSEALAGAMRQARSDLAAELPTDLDPGSVAAFEAVLAVLSRLAQTDALLVVLEDLQWADPETLALVAYLTDNLRGQRVLCLCTARAEQGPLNDALVLADRLEETRAGLVLRLPRLTPEQGDDVAAACLETDEVPPRLSEFLRLHSAGIPRVIEDTLAAALRSDALVRRGDAWVLAGPLTVPLPPGLCARVTEQLSQLDADGRRVIDVLAVAGAGAPSELVRRAAAVDVDAFETALRAARSLHLLQPLGRGLAFVDGLIGHAVLADLPSARRDQLARAALDAIGDLRDAAGNDWRERAASLAELLGEPAAASHLVAAARHASGVGQLATAALLLERARTAAGDDVGLLADVAEANAEALARTGKGEEAVAAAALAVDALATRGAPPARVAGLLLHTARAALVAGVSETVGDLLRRAGDVAERLDDERLDAELASLGAVLALRRCDARASRAQAERALTLAQGLDLPQVACEALDVIGQLSRGADRDAATDAFSRALELAQTHDLRVDEVRALRRLGALDAMTGGSVDGLLRARRAAEGTGAIAEIARLDLSIGWAQLDRHELDLGRDAIDRCLASARRYHLDLLAPALATSARAFAMAGDGDQMEACIEQALDVSGGHAVTAAAAWGDARAHLALIREDRASALEALMTAMQHAVRPVVTVPSLARGLGHLLCVVEAMPVEPLDGEWFPWLRGHAILARAVLAGRAARADEAERLFEEGDALLSAAPWHRRYARRVVAEAAIADGWGEPAAWLRDALEYFEEVRQPAVVAACKQLLQDAGVAVPRRGRGTAEVPPLLRSMGVTSREMDVLQLVAEGLSNAEIGERLFVSPRTVKTHVASLMQKTGASDRGGLREYASTTTIDLRPIAVGLG